jgi:hypothetical protein
VAAHAVITTAQPPSTQGGLSSFCIIRRPGGTPGPIRRGGAFLARWLRPFVTTNAGDYGSRRRREDVWNVAPAESFRQFRPRHDGRPHRLHRHRIGDRRGGQGQRTRRHRPVCDHETTGRDREWTIRRIGAGSELASVTDLTASLQAVQTKVTCQIPHGSLLVACRRGIFSSTFPARAP